MKKKGIVAAGHEKTAEAAALILEEGGNAFDAALAALCAACVVEPALASLGGGGFLQAFDAHRVRTVLYDCFVQTPLRRKPVDQVEFYPILADFGGTQQEFHIGMGAIATPGLVKGLFEIHRDLGSLPMVRLVEPAIRLARDGVRINYLQSYVFDVISAIYATSPAAWDIYGSRQESDRLVREGELLRQPQLADTLEILALEGDRLFYEGEMGGYLAADCAAHGGHLDREDLLAYRVAKRHPLELDYHGGRLLTNSPPSCGGILIAFALKLLETLDISMPEFGTAAYLDLLAQIMGQTNKARVESRIQDMAVETQAQTLLHPEYVRRYRQEIFNRPGTLRGTTHISVIDSLGNAASLSTSNGEGTGYMIPGTGIMINNMLGEEDVNPYGFHRWPTNQRITSMMAPTLMFDARHGIVATGSGGSNRIRSAILQVLLNLIDFGMSPQQAVPSPRIHFERDILNVEAGFEPAEINKLQNQYPGARIWDSLNLFFGGAHTVSFNPSNGHLDGIGDPRRGGACVVVS